MRLWNGVSSPVTVEEPSEAEALEILKGLRPYYEKHHRVSIEDSALEAAVQMSVRYINDRFLPDKAIDIIDEAAAKVRLKSYRTATKTDGLENMLKELLEEKEEAIRQADLEKAREIQSRQREVEQEIKKYRAREERKSQKKSLTVTEASVADIVSDWTKVPVQKLTESESKRLAHLEGILHKRVIGQEEAVKAVAQAVKRGRVGLKDPGRPHWVFPVSGTYRRRKNRAFQGACRGCIRKRAGYDPHRHVGVHGKAQRLKNDRFSAGICGI